MLKYEAEKENDSLTAVIRDSSTGGYEMTVRLDSPRFGDTVVHIGHYNSETAAKMELIELFPDVKWR